MFDVLLGLSAIVNAAVEAVAVKEANELGRKDRAEYLKSDYEKSLEFYEKREAEMAKKTQCFEANSKKKYISVWDKKRKKYHEKEAMRRYKERHGYETGGTENPLAEWVMKHDEMILGILNPGVHVIPKDKLDGMDPDIIAEFLFKTETVEKVEKVPEGLEVTVR